MDYTIPAMEAKVKAEMNLVRELGVFCSKIDILETQMKKALSIMETAQKTFVCTGSNPKMFGDEKFPVMTELQ